MSFHVSKRCAAVSFTWISRSCNFGFQVKWPSSPSGHMTWFMHDMKCSSRISLINITFHWYYTMTRTMSLSCHRFFSSQPIVALLPNGRFFLSRSFSSSDWDRLHAVSLERPPLADQRDDRSARSASSRRNETGVTASICCNLPLRDFAMAPPTSSQSQSPGFLETIRQIAEHRCVRPSWRLKGWSEENGNKSFPENEHWQVLGAIAWGCEWGIRSIHDPKWEQKFSREWTLTSAWCHRVRLWMRNTLNSWSNSSSACWKRVSADFLRAWHWCSDHIVTWCGIHTSVDFTETGVHEGSKQIITSIFGPGNVGQTWKDSDSPSFPFHFYLGKTFLDSPSSFLGSFAVVTQERKLQRTWTHQVFTFINWDPPSLYFNLRIYFLQTTWTQVDPPNLHFNLYTCCVKHTWSHQGVDIGKLTTTWIHQVIACQACCCWFWVLFYQNIFLAQVTWSHQVFPENASQGTALCRFWIHQLINSEI